MFSQGQIVFIIISLVLVAAGLFLVMEKRPPLDRMIRVCFTLGLLSEVIKILSVIQIVPVVDLVTEKGVLVYKETGAYAPYILAEHLPLELCSLQLVFMFLCMVSRRDFVRKVLYPVMYGTAVTGGVVAIGFNRIAPEFYTAAEYLTSVRVWQFYLYHAMIIVLGLYIAVSREADIRFKDIKWMLIVTATLDWMSFYMNSVMTVPFFSGDRFIGVAHAINFFSSYNNPLGIIVRTKSQYLLYLLIRLVLAVLIILLVFVPLKRKDR